MKSLEKLADLGSSLTIHIEGDFIGIVTDCGAAYTRGATNRSRAISKMLNEIYRRYVEEYGDRQ